MLDHIKQYLTCDGKRVKNALLSLLPIIAWMKIYRLKEWLLGDVVSGVSTGLVAVLQGLAYSLLASLPAWYGLYAAFFPVIIYFFLGTSRHISVGAFPVLSLMIGVVVNRMVPENGPPANITAFEGLTMNEQRAIVAASLTFLIGIFQILEGVFGQITSTNLHDLVTSIVVMVVVLTVKELNERFKSKLPVPIPIEVIMVSVASRSTVIACGVSYAFSFKEYYGVDVVGRIPDQFEAPMAPDLQVFRETSVDAFPMAIVGFAVAFAVAKVYSIKHDYVIDGNQELIAFGASNIFGGAFRSLAASTALSRSSVQESTGGKTQVAGVLSAMIVLVVILALGFLLEPLPKSVLGAVVIVNLKGMLMQVCHVPFLWKKDRPDCVVWIVTCVASILLGLDLGLAVGLGAELIAVVFRTQCPRCCVLANIAGTDIYRDRKDYTSIYEPEGVKIFRIPSPIFFANIDFLRGKLIDAVGFNPLRVLRKRNKALRKIRKLLKKGELTLMSKGLQVMGSLSAEDSEDESSIEDLDLPTDFSDLPVQVNWRAELPANISVPPVDIHSLVLDFSAVSFIDITALNGLKMALKEFIRVDVEVYIVACDPYVFEKLKSCEFFDDEIKTSIFFLTLHDAMLHILQINPPLSVSEKVSKLQHCKGFSVTTTLYDEYKKIDRQHKSLRDHVKEYFTCDGKRVKNALLSLLPIIAWMKIYRLKEWLLGDVVSGVSTGLVAVLQGLAFALLASLPPGYGLYSAFFPAVVYFFLGTSRHLSVGPFPVLSLMVGAVVTRIVPDVGPPANITEFEGLTINQQRVIVASSITFLMGIFQLAMGLLQVGFIVIYLSDTLISGFTTAAAVHILVSQLKFVLGLKVPSFSGPLNIFYITKANVADVVTSIIIIVAVIAVKEINERFKLRVPIPIEVIMTIIACGVSYGFNFEEIFKVDVIGNIVNGYESPLAPNVEVMKEGAVDAITIAIVGFAVAFSVAKVYSVKHDYIIDGNQELIAFGASNIFGGAFRSFAASTALSRTAVQESTGGKTQIASLISALIVLITIVGIGFLLEPLPKVKKRVDLKSVLGALVIVNLKGMLMQFREICYLWTRDKTDLVGFSPLRVLRKRNKALRKIKKMIKNGELQMSSSGIKPTALVPASDKLDDENNTDDLDQPTDFSDLPVQVNWKAELPANISVPPVDIHSLVLDFSAVSFIDISALKVLKMTLKEFIRVDVEVYIVSCDVYIREKMHDCMFFDDEIKTSMFFPTLHDVMLHILTKHPDCSQDSQWAK
ncbi:hypothetical protein P4O66_014354, partial [Electrophorus voltai]